MYLTSSALLMMDPENTTPPLQAETCPVSQDHESPVSEQWTDLDPSPSSATSTGVTVGGRSHWTQDTEREAAKSQGSEAPLGSDHPQCSNLVVAQTRRPSLLAHSLVTLRAMDIRALAR